MCTRKFDKKRDLNDQCSGLQSKALNVWVCGPDVQLTWRNVCRFVGYFKIICLELKI